MDAQTFRQTYLRFFSEREHTIIGSAPLIPQDDASVLFTTAGMQPLVPYLMGEAHPGGRRLTNVQKCLRTDDIDEVGDNRHLTFFEMLGNWSLGDYGKEQSIRWSYEFLIEQLGLDPNHLSVTCFAGDENSPRDNEAAEVWRSLDIPKERIFFLPKVDNWWGPVGTTGPCGPDTEMFYDIEPDGHREQTLLTHPARFPEIWNNVFMQYIKQPDCTYDPLPRLSVDTGMSLDRMLPIMQGVPSVFETDLLKPVVEDILSLAPHPDERALRIISDHIRAAMFILAEGIVPGNVDQPYIARRLIRRAVRYGTEIGIKGHFLSRLAETAIRNFRDQYPELEARHDHICSTLEDEEVRFSRTLTRGYNEFERAVKDHQDSKQLPGGIVTSGASGS